ncbi:NYN domain-containing protein [Dehalococcoidia bacterium]|nr:NYN domain-containing protein [Dehalococcoidia bacterium]
MPQYRSLYDSLESAGYTMKYKKVPNTKKGETKGIIDPELVLQAMIDINEYDRAVLVNSDGDFACLVNHWRDKGKLECVL